MILRANPIPGSPRYYRTFLLCSVKSRIRLAPQHTHARAPGVSWTSQVCHSTESSKQSGPLVAHHTGQSKQQIPQDGGHQRYLSSTSSSSASCLTLIKDYSTDELGRTSFTSSPNSPHLQCAAASD